MVTSTPIAAAVVARMKGGYAQSSVPLVTMMVIDLALFDSLDDILVPPLDPMETVCVRSSYDHT